MLTKPSAPQQATAAVLKGRRVLTTTIKEGYPPWGERTELPPGWADEIRRTGGQHQKAPLRSDLYWAWKIYRLSRKYDAIVTGFERAALLCLLLQRLARPRPVPHIFLYTNMNLPERRCSRFLKRLYFRRVIQSATRIVLYSQRQLKLYAQVFRVPEEKFACIPYYETLYGVDYPTSEGDYIFAGGDYTRDYAGFIEAVRPLPYRVVIAALFRHYFRGIDVPKHVEVTTASHDGFMRLMAGAGVVVVPLRGGLLHPGGQQTYLNAMSLGKPVVVADDGGADEYITRGLNGMVLQPGDPVALRQAIKALMDDRELARRMGERAREAAAEFTPARFFDGILTLVDQSADPRG